MTLFIKTRRVKCPKCSLFFLTDSRSRKNCETCSPPFMQRQGFFENIMKLYNLPRDTFFTIQEDDSKTVYFLENVDGMFSYCKNEAGNVVHFSASLEVDIYE